MARLRSARSAGAKGCGSAGGNANQISVTEPRRCGGATVLSVSLDRRGMAPFMVLSKKLKTALDETRMLMLGAQILLGFGLRSAFADAFDQLPPHSRMLD